MKCENCDKDACACVSRWINGDALLVLYYCKEHAPEDEDVEFFDPN